MTQVHNIIIHGNRILPLSKMYYSWHWNITHGYKFFLVGTKISIMAFHYYNSVNQSISVFFDYDECCNAFIYWLRNNIWHNNWVRQIVLLWLYLFFTYAWAIQCVMDPDSIYSLTFTPTIWISFFTQHYSTLWIQITWHGQWWKIMIWHIQYSKICYRIANVIRHFLWTICKTIPYICSSNSTTIYLQQPTLSVQQSMETLSVAVKVYLTY